MPLERARRDALRYNLNSPVKVNYSLCASRSDRTVSWQGYFDPILLQPVEMKLDGTLNPSKS